MALILDGNGLIQGLSAGGLPDGSVNASSLASTLDLSSKTMTFGNVTASGITFPASQSASGNPNTLDDYEEGTWTPTLPAGGTIGDGAGCVYVKIGKCVYFNAYLSSISNIPNDSETFRVGGFPFTPGSSGGQTLHGNAVLTYTASTNTTAAGGGLIDTSARAYWHKLDGGSLLLNSNMTGTTQLNFAGLYFV